MHEQDVIIVGGGIMGCAIAWRLALAGKKVTVIEKSVPGAEASSAAAGMLAPQKESNSHGALLTLGLLSRSMYPHFVEELQQCTGMQVDLVPSGTLEVALTEEHRAQLSKKVSWQTAGGLSALFLDGEAARKKEPRLSPNITGAAYFPSDMQVDSRKLIQALSVAAAQAGVTFRGGYVRAVQTANSRVSGVDVEGTLLMASHVVVAAGSWSGLIQGIPLTPQLLRPVRGQMVQFETRLPLISHIVASNRGYLVPRKDGRLIAGSTSEFAGFEKKVTAQGVANLLQMALELCPELSSVPVTQMWAGLRPYAEDALPIISTSSIEGLLFATGHHRNGILLAPVTALLVTDMILDRPISVDLTPFRLSRLGNM